VEIALIFIEDHIFGAKAYVFERTAHIFGTTAPEITGSPLGG
jgi:hypothetical protein